MLKRFFIGTVSCFTLSQAAYAAGYGSGEFSASDLGRANAGSITQTNDASGAYTNPALMSRFDRPTLSFSAMSNFPTSEYKDKGSVDLQDNPITGDDDKGFINYSLVPGQYYVHPYNDKMTFGLSLAVPYGSNIKYANGWPGRLQADRSKLKVINISPAVSYQYNDNLAFGFGIDVQHSETIQKRGVDYGAACLKNLASTLQVSETVAVQACVDNGLGTAQTVEAGLDYEGDDLNFGWNAGFVYDVNDILTVAAHYRTGMTHEHRGTVVFDVPAAASILTTDANADGNAAFDTTQGTNIVKVPATLQIGTKMLLGEKTVFFGNLQWTEWSDMQEIGLVFDNPDQPDALEDLNWEDTYRISLGLDYSLRPDWIVRGGVAYDQSPMQNGFRMPRIPDSDRRIGSFGLTYEGFSKYKIDLAYMRTDLAKSRIDRTSNSLGERVLGDVKIHVDTMALGVTRNF